MAAHSRRGIALVIGVGRYAHPGISQLNHAVDDADALADLLTDPEVGGLPTDRVVRLTDAAASRDAVVEHLSEWLPGRSAGAEIAVIYFAGHGLARAVGNRHEGYLLPHDADPRNPAVRGIAMADLTKWVESIKAEAVVVCLDCCHAGLAMTFRDAERDIGIRPDEVRRMAGKGRFLMVACDEGQKSAEIAALGHGLFTEYLLRGIDGEGDRDGDGKVGLAELFEYVSAEVAAETRNAGFEQRPWTEVVAAGGEYISRRRPVRPPTASDGSGDGPEAAVAEIRRRMATASGPQLEKLLRQARTIDGPLAVPLVVPRLAHPDDAVARTAKQVMQAIGIERTFAAVEEMARRKSPDLGAVLEGLGALGARADLVALLDRVVDHADGAVLVQATNLMEVKRLKLGLEDMRRLFAENRVPYELIRPLGKGQLTAAYLADDPDGGMQVVVRVLLGVHVRADDTGVRRQFFGVCQRSLQLRSEYVVKTHLVRAFRTDGTYYTVREYLDSPTLQQILAGRPPDVPGRRFSPPQAAEIVRQMLTGLVAVHAAGGCHGAVRPSNVFVCAGDRVVLGDLAPVLPVGPSGKDTRGAYNFRYTPPEVFRGDPAEARTDVYAVGCVAYELFSGVPPFASDRFHDQYVGHTGGAIPPLRANRPDLPGEVQAFVHHLLALDPTARPTAAEALVELDVVRAVLARPDSPVQPPHSPPPTSTEAVWYFVISGESIGPVSFKELKTAAAGRLSPSDLVWKVGMPDWVVAASIDGLFEPPAAPGETTIQPLPAGPVPLVRAKSLADYRPARTRMSVGGDRSLLPSAPSGISDPVVDPATSFTTSDGRASRVRPAADRPAALGGYEILGEIGRGGMGTVYLARDVLLQREVAIKMMHPQLTADRSGRERFLREARAVAAVDHDNIVPILQIGEASDGNPFIVMPLLKGEPLQAALQRDMLPSVDLILKVALDVADGLASAHAVGLVHRDIKPANIWLDGDPRSPDPARRVRRCRILDFGLAHTAGDDHTTAVGAVLGTPAYMSPEQAQGRRVDHRADLWSLGVVLYRMATGVMPFRGPSAISVIYSLVADSPPPVRDLAPHLPPSLAELIERLMQKDPAARPHSAAEVVAAAWQMMRALADDPYPASDPGPNRVGRGGTSPAIELSASPDSSNSLLELAEIRSQEIQSAGGTESENSDDKWPFLAIPILPPPEPPPSLGLRLWRWLRGGKS